MPVVLRTKDAKHQGADFAATMAQLTSVDGFLLQVADVQSVNVYVFDMQDLSTAIYGPTALTVANVMFDVPQTGNGAWTEDPIGYNFRHDLKAATVFAITPEKGMHTYRIEYQIQATPQDGSGLLLVVRESYSWPIASIA